MKEGTSRNPLIQYSGNDGYPWCPECNSDRTSTLGNSDHPDYPDEDGKNYRCRDCGSYFWVPNSIYE